MTCKKPLKNGVILAAALLIVSVWGTIAAADSIPPRISMSLPASAATPGTIKTRVLDDTGIGKVTLYYRKPGESYFNSIDMEREPNDVYQRALDRELGLKGTVEYFILAQDTSGNQTTEPRLDPEQNPLVGSASDVVNESAPEVHLTTPEAGTVLDTGDEPIMISFFNTERQIDFNTVRLRIDKRDRTAEAEFVGNILIWEPRRPISDGYHEIEVSVRDTNNEYIGPNIWTFRVKTRRELPLGAEGDVYIGIRHDDRSGKSGSTVPLWNNKIDVGMKGQTGPLNWTGGVMLSSEETGFLTTETLENRQPINRFYFDGSTRHFRVRVGDSNPNFSELTMKGILVRGVNLQFKSSRFNAQFVKGYNKRSIDEDVYIPDNPNKKDERLSNVTPVKDTTDQYYTHGDTTNVFTTSQYQDIILDPVTQQYNVYEYAHGTPQRNVTALQMDVVPLKNKYINWKVGFNAFSAEDDSTSLNYTPTNVDGNEDGTTDFVRAYNYKSGSFDTNYTPMKNWVGTFETSIRFNDNRSELAAEFGGTLATENMFGVIDSTLQKELPEGIDDSLFRFNGSTQTSFDKQKLSKNVGAGVSDAIMSVYKLRLTTPVPIPKAATNFKAELYRVPTHYISLGNPQQKTDIGGYKFDLRTRILRDQLSFNLGYDTYSDNLDSERKQYESITAVANPDGSTSIEGTMKDLTKDTTVMSVTMTARPRILPENMPSATIGFRTYTAENNIDTGVYNDTYKVGNTTRDMVNTTTSTLLLSFSGMLPVDIQRHTGTLSISSMNINDDRPVLPGELNESTNLSVMFNVNSELNFIPLSLMTSLARTNNASFIPVLDAQSVASDRSEIVAGINMLNVSGTYKWFRDKRLTTTAGFGLLTASNDAEDIQYKMDNSKVTFKLEGNYRLNSVSTIGAQLRFIDYSDTASSINDYTEPIFGITLRSAF